MWTRFFATLAPSRLAHHLAHPSVHLCTPLCTFAHPCTPLCFTFSGLVTLIRLSSDLGPPSGYHGQPSPSATRHSAHSGPLYNQVQPLWPHVAHLPSLWACTTHIAIQGSGPTRSPVAKAAPIFHHGKPCNRLTNYSIPWPMGREILLSGQDSNLSSLGAYKGLALMGG